MENIYFIIFSYTKIKGKKRLLAELTERNIEFYLPAKKVLKPCNDRKVWVEEPVFKRYIFVKVSYKEFFIVLKLPGVICYVNFEGKAMPVSESEILNMKTFLAQTDHKITLTYELVKKSLLVEVTQGSLKGMKGELINVYGQARLIMRIETMNCCLCANVSRDEIKILDERIRSLGRIQSNPPGTTL